MITELTTGYDSRADTLQHISRVQQLLNAFARDLIERGERHDNSKLGPEEKPLFDEMTPKLKELVYGSDEYKASLAALGPALQHHYATNSHHPEHYPNGVDDMDLADLVEMFIDWKAASERTSGGDFRKSVEVNAMRFKLSPQIVSIFMRTAERMGFIAQ